MQFWFVESHWDKRSWITRKTLLSLAYVLFYKEGRHKKDKHAALKKPCVFIPKAYDSPLEKFIQQLGS